MVPPPLAGVTAAHLQHGDQGPLKHPRSPLLTRGPLRNFPPRLPPRLGMRPRGLGGGVSGPGARKPHSLRLRLRLGPCPRGSTSLLLAQRCLLLDSLCESHLVPLQTLGVCGAVFPGRCECGVAVEGLLATAEGLGGGPDPGNLGAVLRMCFLRVWRLAASCAGASAGVCSTGLGGGPVQSLLHTSV